MNVSHDLTGVHTVVNGMQAAAHAHNPRYRCRTWYWGTTPIPRALYVSMRSGCPSPLRSNSSVAVMVWEASLPATHAEKNVGLPATSVPLNFGVV